MNDATTMAGMKCLRSVVLFGSPRLADTSPGSSVSSKKPHFLMQSDRTVRIVHVADMTAMRAMRANRCWKAWYRSLAIAFVVPAWSVQSLAYVAPASRGSGLPKPKAAGSKEGMFPSAPALEAQPLTPPRAASGAASSRASTLAQGAEEATHLAACTVEERRPTGSLLEEWFVRDATGDFENWRSRGSSDEVSVRCRAVSETRAEDITCLECVSHVSDVPFTSHPRDALLPSERRRQATLDALASVMQARLVSPWRDGSMELCRRAAAGENAFCKSAAMTVPA
eukprot:s755_g27.t1